MKNKDLICAGLLSLIVILSGIAVCYYVIKVDAIKKSEEPSTSIPDRTEPSESTGNETSVETQIPDESTNEVINNSSGEVGLKKISTYAEFDALVNREYNTFYVLGRTGCQFCEMYTPVLEKVVNEKSIEIVYVDLAMLTSEDYYSVLNSPIKIPAKCTKTGVEADLKDGFGTPLGLFINAGSSYDCIRGYQDEENLIKKLKHVGYID